MQTSKDDSARLGKRAAEEKSTPAIAFVADCGYSLVGRLLSILQPGPKLRYVKSVMGFSTSSSQPTITVAVRRDLQAHDESRRNRARVLS